VRGVLGSPNGRDGIITADFRHIELRIVATLSGDILLRDVLVNRDSDPFTELARRLGVSRSIAKSTLYGTLYGAQTDIAMDLRSTFSLQYPRAAAWIDATLRHVRARGMVHDMFGRPREIDPARALTTAVNAVCQSSCAGILHRALETLDATFPGTLVLCLHDEVLLQGSPDMCDQIRRCMEETHQGSIPFFVTCRWAPTWGSD
jgi:DNA polymerase I-like protein with 3'-5' exonuclease and polymerase domains